MTIQFIGRVAETLLQNLPIKLILKQLSNISIPKLTNFLQHMPGWAGQFISFPAFCFPRTLFLPKTTFFPSFLSRFPRNKNTIYDIKPPGSNFSPPLCTFFTISRVVFGCIGKVLAHTTKKDHFRFLTCKGIKKASSISRRRFSSAFYSPLIAVA